MEAVYSDAELAALMAGAASDLVDIPFDATPVRHATLADRIVRTNVRESVEFGTRSPEVRRATYPPLALQELMRNAVMHRAYEGTNSPVQLYWFAEHVEIINPGGPYGEVTPSNFGQLGLVDYRNPNLADAMRVTGLVQRYGAGLPSVRDAQRANEQREPRFEVDAHWVKCFVTMRADWPGNRPARE